MSNFSDHDKHFSMSACRFEPRQCGIDDILGVLGGLIESVILNGVLLTCVVHCCCGSSALHTQLINHMCQNEVMRASSPFYLNMKCKHTLILRLRPKPTKGGQQSPNKVVFSFRKTA